MLQVAGEQGQCVGFLTEGTFMLAHLSSFSHLTATGRNYSWQNLQWLERWTWWSVSFYYEAAKEEKKKSSNFQCWQIWHWCSAPAGQSSADETQSNTGPLYRLQHVLLGTDGRSPFMPPLLRAMPHGRRGLWWCFTDSTGHLSTQKLPFPSQTSKKKSQRLKDWSSTFLAPSFSASVFLPALNFTHRLRWNLLLKSRREFISHLLHLWLFSDKVKRRELKIMKISGGQGTDGDPGILKLTCTVLPLSLLPHSKYW